MTDGATTPRIRVLVADDDGIVRIALATYVAEAPDLVLVAAVATADEALQRVAREPVDVVLLDVRMPGHDGLWATREIARRPSGRPHVLLLTSFDSDDLVQEAVRARARGLLLKSTDADAILDAIRSVHRGTTVFSHRPIERLVSREDVPPPGLAPRFSGREREVLGLLCKAYSNADIARRLNLSESRVKAHVSAIMTKLGVDSRLKVVVRAFEWGLTPRT